MKRIKKLIADAVFYAGHYGSKASNILLELGLELHVNFDTETGRKITTIRSDLEQKLREMTGNKPATNQQGGSYVRGQSIFVKTKPEGKG